MSYRVFIGLEIPDAVAAPLGLLCSGVPDARWVERHNLHITLRFVGDVDGALLDDIHGALAGVSVPRFDLMLSGVDRFGDKRRTRSIWGGVEPVGGISALAAKIDQALMGIGLDPEGRKYKPHVTLARLKATSQGRVLQWLENHGGFSTPAFTVDHFVLYRSHLSQAGADYEVLETYPLQ